jgi:hypothetical protein
MVETVTGHQIDSKFPSLTSWLVIFLSYNVFLRFCLFLVILEIELRSLYLLDRMFLLLFSGHELIFFKISIIYSLSFCDDVCA